MKGVTGTPARFFRAENHFPAPERKDHEKTYQSPHVRPQVAAGFHVRLEDEFENAERRYSVVTEFDVAHLMNLTWFVCAAANALTTPGVTFGSMQSILDDLRQKLEGEKE